MCARRVSVGRLRPTDAARCQSAYKFGVATDSGSLARAAVVGFRQGSVRFVNLSAVRRTQRPARALATTGRCASGINEGRMSPWAHQHSGRWVCSIVATGGGARNGSLLTSTKTLPGESESDAAPRVHACAARCFSSALRHEPRAKPRQVNGQPVSDHLFRPGWTSYDKRLQYDTYDITGLVRSGANAIAVTLGDGWYRRARRIRGQTEQLRQATRSARAARRSLID